MNAPYVPTIDAHMHLWDPDLLSYPWLQQHPQLQRRYGVEDYPGLDLGGDWQVDAAVVVEANVRDGAGLVESAWLDWVTATRPRIVGIVAYVDMLDEPRRAHVLAQLRRTPRVVGVRHNIQGNPPGFSTQRRFVAGVRAVGETGYPFDLCVTAAQLGEVRELVSLCPDVRFILDHCGKPDIRGGAFDDWRRGVDALAAHDTVTCKLSGLFTEAGTGHCDERTLRPYLRHVIESFGPRRVMYASDWPVCTLEGGAHAWHALVTDVICGLCSRNERSEILGGTAIRTYRLSMQLFE